MPNPSFKRSRSVLERNVVEQAQKMNELQGTEFWLRKRRRQFTILDPEKTGYVSRRGHEVLAERIAEYTSMSAEDAARIRELMVTWWDDVMKGPDGTLDCDQFCKISYVLLTDPDLKEDFAVFATQASTKLFNVIDTNHDGIISRHEWRVWFKCIDVTDDTVADAAFDSINLSKDGKMTLHEFNTGILDFNFNQESGRYDLFFGQLSED